MVSVSEVGEEGLQESQGRDDAVGVAPDDLIVAVHVGDGQGSLTAIIIAY